MRFIHNNMPIGPGAIRLCRSCSSHTIDTYLVESGDLLGRNNAVCTNIGECAAVCPKSVPLEVITRLNRDLGHALWKGQKTHA